jgi:hypothetical protein
MSLFRSLIVRQTMAALFLLTGLLTHSQEIFACHLMGDQLQFVCCCGQPVADGCEMGGGCGASDRDGAAGCCEVSVAKLPGFQAPSFALSHLLVTLLDGPQPPPGILPSAPNDAGLPSQLLTYPGRFSLPFWFLGTRTYLLTHRWRN